MKIFRHLKNILLPALLLTLTACRTLEYRTVQSDFEQAVRADNAGSPFSRQHEDVVDRLTPAYIARLDARLRPNAWMLRAVAAWRAGLAEIPEQSARSGLAENAKVAGSRDEIVLLLIPALVTDSDLQRRWLAANRTLAETNYISIFEPSFKAAVRQFSETVAPAMNDKTPVDARAYASYHHWRILLNWAAVIASIKPVTAAGAAQDRANEFVGADSLSAAAKLQLDKIPEDHPLHALIAAQSRK